MTKTYLSFICSVLFSLSLLSSQIPEAFDQYFIVEQAYSPRGHFETELTLHKVKGDEEVQWVIKEIDVTKNKIICEGGHEIYLHSGNFDVNAFLRYFGHQHKRVRHMRLNPTLLTQGWLNIVPATYSTLSDAAQRTHTKFLCDFALDGTYQK